MIFLIRIDAAQVTLLRDALEMVINECPTDDARDMFDMLGDLVPEDDDNCDGNLNDLTM